MTQAIVFDTPGGPEMLRLADIALPAPAQGEVLIRQTAIGVNFVDTYLRSGLYPMPFTPCIPGVEGAGIIEALGDGVTTLRVGDRVAYAGNPVGGYARHRVLPASRLIALPDHVDDRVAAASMLRGLTAYMLLFRVTKLQPGQTVLIHAAAGGLGLFVTQWAKRLGVRTIGTVGSAAKAEIALAHGLDHAILYREQDFVAVTRALTDGKGVDAAIDGIGADTLTKTLDCVRPFGIAVSVGQASGPVGPFTLGDLGPPRCIALARPSMLAYANDIDDYRTGAAALFDVLRQGLQTSIGHTYELAQAAQAHGDLEAGRTTGSLLLIP